MSFCKILGVSQTFSCKIYKIYTSWLNLIWDTSSHRTDMGCRYIYFFSGCRYTSAVTLSSFPCVSRGSLHCYRNRAARGSGAKTLINISFLLVIKPQREVSHRFVYLSKLYGTKLGIVNATCAHSREK